ncbi:hypothetical protein L1887_28784 [Cichorium endivia]|nr:hypothetical protein L1887_28784 [Cichorium endivia]
MFMTNGRRNLNHVHDQWEKKFTTQQQSVQYLSGYLANMKTIVETTISTHISEQKKMLADEVSILKQTSLKLDMSIVKLTQAVKFSREMYEGDTHSSFEATYKLVEDVKLREIDLQE